MNRDVLVVVDMQNDFLTGSLAVKDADEVIKNVCTKILSWPKNGQIWVTQDTHKDSYLSSHEGIQIPVPHCIRGTEGWKIHPDVLAALEKWGKSVYIIKKDAFGSTELMISLRIRKPSYIEMVGVCTDICVLCDAVMLRSALPETDITVDASCCKGITPESHTKALDIMKGLGIEIINA